MMAPETDRRRYLVISDAHFGTAESAVNNPRFAQALVDHIVANAPWTEIVFTGDLLDVNLATFKRSIEGGEYPDAPVRLLGFREFLKALHDGSQRGQGSGLTSIARRWVYIPGNHDYKVWDMLSTKVACEDVLAEGHPMGHVPSPLKQYKWHGDHSFFAGIFKPFGASDNVTVTYPNHEIAVGGDHSAVVLTHGHYLDPSQTWGHSLHKELARATNEDQKRAILRRLFIDTAQYQTVASAVSFTKRARAITNALFGPSGILDKAKTLLSWLATSLLHLLTLGQGSRGRRISSAMLLTIEQYVDEFTPYSPRPRWFLFGHTHRQDSAQTPTSRIRVFNVGSFYRDQYFAMTFAELEVTNDRDLRVKLMCVDQEGAVRPSAAA